ncbi:CARDB domain-containing protein [Nostoc parmelioides]|uniref:S8 family serine peptidase n=1 Tax=Nostoc parmelioides FACHB-3921 TaxID=2692909 RepID=A0ABR8BIU0_9NOSO|nr:CARDB domain-containing protein [Nostoc parmelioides]MBD2252805.1 S8 family serine peptidase [Nostoc parmelioides FACHB-3921]
MSVTREYNNLSDTLSSARNSRIFNSNKDYFPLDAAINSIIGSSYTGEATEVLVSNNYPSNDLRTNDTSNANFTQASFLPDLTAPIGSIPISANVGSSIQINYQIRNQGSTSAGYSFTNFYLSPDFNLDSTDRYLGFDYVSGLAVGASSQESATLTIGSNINPGNYYLIYYVDGDGYVSESNENNNIFGAAISITQPDLTVLNASIPTSARVGSSIQINYQVRNQGNGSAGDSNTRFYLSPDLNIDSSDFYLGLDYVSGLAAGASRQESATFTIGSNINPGNYYLIYYADADGYVSESNENNNAFGNLINITSAGNPDLIIQNNPTAPTTASVGSTIQLSYQVKNQGVGNAVANTTRFYLSRDTTFSTDDVLLGSDSVASIAPGAVSAETASIVIANSIAAGNYHLLFRTDADSTVAESDETNNVVSRAITINTADLIVQNPTAPTTASVGSAIALSYQVRNQGAGNAVASTTRFYLSRDTAFSTDDVLLGSDSVASIAAGAVSAETASIVIANSIAAGNYHLLFRTDADSTVAEGNETNNVVSRAITINTADLIVQNATAPTTASVGSAIALSYQVRNQGAGNAVASTTRFYLSRDTTFSTDDVLLGSDTVNSIAAGAVSSETASIVIANSIAGGNYHLLFRADADSTVAESNETNNVASRAITVNGPRPDLIIQNISAPSVVDPGLFTLNYQIANQGTASAGNHTTKIYLSRDTNLSSDDILLASDPNYFYPVLNAGTYSSESYYLSISRDINFGNYHLLLQADGNGEISESNETNNVTAKAITIAAPDLIVQNPSAPTSANIGTTISLSYQLKNQGNGNAGFHFTNFYLSQDQTLSNDDVYLGFDSISSLAPSAVASRSTSLTIRSNTVTGNYYLLYRADGDGTRRESNENNNVAARAITITAPDLVIQNATSASSATIGTTLQVNYQLKNQGNGTAGGSKTSFYLSRDTAFGDDDIDLGIETQANASVTPGSFISRSTSITFNPTLNPGQYYLILRADGAGSVAESNESNNGFYISTRITLNPANGGGFNSTTGYGLVNAAAAVAKALNQSTFADVADLGGNDWGADAIKAPEVWARGYTGQGIIVAVVDSGVDYTHPDLSANMWRNSRETAGNGIDDDGNGFIDDIYGWNFLDNNNDPLDRNGHGTHVAGTIAATRNSFGVTGIAYNAKIMALRTGGRDPSDSSISFEAVNNSIRYAADNGAKVINLSLGGSSTNIERLQAIQYAISKGAIVVSASGNEGQSLPGYPARYADQFGIAVGAVNYNRTLTDFSNRPGTTPLAYVTAPGAYSDYFDIGIYSTLPGGQYGLMPGTSMAAPHVAGVVALMLSAKNNLTDAQARQILTSTAANGGTLPSANLSALSNTGSSNTTLSGLNSSYTSASLVEVSNWTTIPREQSNTTDLANLIRTFAYYQDSRDYQGILSSPAVNIDEESINKRRRNTPKTVRIS